jgi:hypothetical protein
MHQRRRALKLKRFSAELKKYGSRFRKEIQNHSMASVASGNTQILYVLHYLVRLHRPIMKRQNVHGDPHGDLVGGKVEIG